MNILNEIKNKYGEQVVVFEKNNRRAYIDAPKEIAKELVKFLYCDLGARMSTASGVDTKTGIEILYHMSFDKYALVVSVRVIAPKPDPEMPTFTDFMPSTEWVEREIHEMLGVNFIGHPNLKRLLLPDDWPNGVYPYRKKTFESEKENNG
jgi:Ni,Fe-hydrogenase III component G